MDTSIVKRGLVLALVGLSLIPLGCRNIAAESGETAIKGVGKKIAGKVLKEKVKETFKNPQNNPTQTQETWTQVGADQNGWVYYQSNYGRRMAKNVYTGQEVPL